MLGVAEEVSEQIADRINPANQTHSKTPRHPRQRKREALYNKLLHDKLDHLSQEDRLHIEPVLGKFEHVFHEEESNDFKGRDITEHQIDVGDARPIRRPQYRVPYALRGNAIANTTHAQTKDYKRKPISLDSSVRLGP